MTKLDTWAWREKHDGSLPTTELPCRIKDCEANPAWEVEKDSEWIDVTCGRHLYPFIMQVCGGWEEITVRRLDRRDTSITRTPQTITVTHVPTDGSPPSRWTYQDEPLED